MSESMPVFAQYRKRHIRFLELFEQGGWAMKVYGITRESELPDDGLLEALRATIRGRVPEVAGDGRNYGLGFAIVHQGVDANYFLVDWWVEENALMHHLFRSPLVDPTAVEYISPTGLTACIWELQIFAFERQAWIDHVLTPSAGPDFARYLAARLDADV